MLKTLVRAALCALAFLPVIAHAQNTGTAQLSCTLPTTNTDGSTIAGAQLPLKVNFYEGTTQGGPYPNASPQQNACAFTFTALAIGAHFFTATVTDARGQVSARSNEATKTIPPPVPNPPTLLTLVASNAYDIQKQNGTLLLLKTGEVAANTAINPSETLVTKGVLYCGLPSSAVTKWVGSGRPPIVYVPCG